MRPLRSLSSRLIVYWIAGSLVTFFALPPILNLAMSALSLFEPETNLESWTTRRARTLVAGALRKDEVGAKFIAMTDDLRIYAAANPAFRYAALEIGSNAPLRGSSLELTPYFQTLHGLDLHAAAFHLEGDPNPDARGLERTMNTPVGRAKIIVYGSKFHWDDVFYQIYSSFTAVGLMSYGLLASVVALIAFAVVREALAPLRAVAAKVSQIDVNSLRQHIPTDRLPAELSPFIDAVNTALRRVDDGVARQKRFTANSAHELRTPITVLTARVEKLETTPLKLDIQRDVRRIRTIVEQLLVLAQISEKGVTAASAPNTIDLVEALIAIVADLAPVALDNHRYLELEAPSEPIYIPAYRWAIESVVINLIENALRAEPDNGVVLVRATAGAVIEVIDHGPGIAPPERGMVFEPFWRGGDDTPGTGLGLSIVRELVEKMQGSIAVDETPGGGTTFAVQLPLCDASTAPRGGPPQNGEMRPR
ncbi:two-component sensor histidine kinase [Methylosinus sp. C49]|uniref:sensor histidine kinase n=1 Tax=Methylosinus sp. C49 TaxID=2699395 RepID=UPI001366A11A|nr:HAMP domain-containing sensor histidine kinase [Methylosinus sp. C49]BBU60469.1 two-component sensor histidine kinase [Methylosinus sp. C49]